MPFVIYIFAISAFALGLAEFVPIGLTGVMAASLHLDIEQTGSAITSYALGATIAAPVLTALTAHWPRQQVMLATALVFTAGSLCAALATDLTLLLLARFVAGMGHGLFLAVASSTAARLAGADKAGRAVAVVFSGFTLAMAVGVPVCTWLGNIISWRPVLGGIAIFGAIGAIGLTLGMQDPLVTAQPETPRTITAKLSPLFDRRLLMATLVTVLAYAGSFTAYTFITPLLTDITHVSSGTVSLFMLLYGVMAAIGNLLGGRLTDSIGILRANAVLISGIILTVLAMWIWAYSPLAMGILIAFLGLFTFAVVPSLQARLLGIARAHRPDADSIAAGLNIAGFNSGIVCGSLLSTLTVSQISLSAIGLIGALTSLAGLCVMFWQTPHPVLAQAKPVCSEPVEPRVSES